jgi:hypothetical protein
MNVLADKRLDCCAAEQRDQLASGQVEHAASAKDWRRAGRCGMARRDTQKRGAGRSWKLLKRPSHATLVG